MSAAVSLSDTGSEILSKNQCCESPPDLDPGMQLLLHNGTQAAVAVGNSDMHTCSTESISSSSLEGSSSRSQRISVYSKVGNSCLSLPLHHHSPGQSPQFSSFIFLNPYWYELWKALCLCISYFENWTHSDQLGKLPATSYVVAPASGRRAASRLDVMTAKNSESNERPCLRRGELAHKEDPDAAAICRQHPGAQQRGKVKQHLVHSKSVAKSRFSDLRYNELPRAKARVRSPMDSLWPGWKHLGACSCCTSRGRRSRDEAEVKKRTTKTVWPMANIEASTLPQSYMVHQFV